MGLSSLSAGIDVPAYFQRIGYDGWKEFGRGRECDIRTLRSIVHHHTQAIPFENLDPFLRRPVRLDPEFLQEKLVHDGRGGYCYEQNLLMSYVLHELGLGVTGLAARVLWNRPADAPAPRSHMLLRVEVAGESWIVDVGFGGMTPTVPLRLQSGVEQITPHEPFRLYETPNGDFLMQAYFKGEWRSLYRFDLQEQLLADYEVSNWYITHHPDSHFVNGLLVSQAVPDGRYALSNAEFKRHRLDGTTERTQLRSGAELRRVLTEVFRINVPVGPDVDGAFERLVSSVREGREG